MGMVQNGLGECVSIKSHTVPVVLISVVKRKLDVENESAEE